MFENLGWSHLMVLGLVGLIVLGPERLPGAIRWAVSALRQARDYISGATSQLRDELGPEFDELREPIGELQKLRRMTPRAVLTQHLLDGDDSLFTAMSDLRAEPASWHVGDRADVASVLPTGPNAVGPSTGGAERPGEATPFDRDST
jgi:sec-independent protein translocase protein TatB